MSSNTPNLNLLKKDTTTDGNEAFNIEAMLNDNWDKIDESVGSKETPADAQSKVDTAMTNHVNASDPHPQYETSVEAQAKVDTAMNNHFNAADPHPQYATDSDLTTHKNATAVHGATSAATPSVIVARAANGTAKVAAPVAEDDIALKSNVTTVQTNLTSHLNAADPHGQYLLESAYATKADIDYYVNATTGNDSNAGTTAGTAFKTIMAAINKLPQTINHLVNIYVAAGTYAETLSLIGFQGKGKISVLGGADYAGSVNYKCDFIYIVQNSISIYIKGFRTTSAAAYIARAVDNIDAYIDYCGSEVVATGQDGFIAGTGFLAINGCTASNRLNAIHAYGGANILSSVNSGTGNTVGLCAQQGGVIAKTGGQPSGTTAESTGNGGVIR